jgi:hypothetical protein
MSPTSPDTLHDIDAIRALEQLEVPVEAGVEVDVAVENEVEVFDEAERTPEPIVAGGLFVARSAIHGTGVFADQFYDVDDIIEQCPVLVVAPADAPRVASTTFGDYVYEWEGGYALALGFGSLYNHSRSPSARYEMDYDVEEIHVIAMRPIEPGEEITINYNGDPDDQSPVWFEPDVDV